MNPLTLTKQYLAEKQILQLATLHDLKPWISTVHFVADDDMNLYWLSLPTRRHSEDIARNPNVAVAVVVKADWPVAGLQFEGTAKEVYDPHVVKVILQRYLAIYDRGKDFYENFMAGRNQHILYRFTPKRGQLFDEVNFPGGIPQELDLSERPEK
jgi:uncharacterized pyridoxamine 5'-phosphate oxidase family protein